MRMLFDCKNMQILTYTQTLCGGFDDYAKKSTKKVVNFDVARI